MVKSITERTADIVVASLTRTLERDEYVEYLPAIGTETYAIFIKAASTEDLDWLVFLRPFQLEAWIGIIVICILTTFFVVFLRCFYSGDRGCLNSSCTGFWTVFLGFFGRKASTRLLESNVPLRTLLFGVLFSGNVAFMAFNASLTSHLSTRQRKMPFSTLEGLLESKYRYYLLLFISPIHFQFYEYTLTGLL